MYYIKGNAFSLKGSVSSLRSRRLEVVGERDNGRARETSEGFLLLARAFFFSLCPLPPSACYAG